MTCFTISAGVSNAPDFSGYWVFGGRGMVWLVAFEMRLRTLRLSVGSYTVMNSTSQGELDVLQLKLERSLLLHFLSQFSILN